MNDRNASVSVDCGTTSERVRPSRIEREYRVVFEWFHRRLRVSLSGSVIRIFPQGGPDPVVVRSQNVVVDERIGVEEKL